MEYADMDALDSIAGGIAGDIAHISKNISNQAIEIIEDTERDIAGGIAGNQASTIAGWIHVADNQINDIADEPDSNQVSTIAGGIAGGIADNQAGGIAIALEKYIKTIDILCVNITSVALI
jgi:hypothetical protein